MQGFDWILSLVLLVVLSIDYIACKRLNKLLKVHGQDNAIIREKISKLEAPSYH